jgi:hypothetical protein
MASQTKKVTQGSKARKGKASSRVSKTDGGWHLGEVSVLIDLVDDLFVKCQILKERVDELEQRYKFVAYPWTETNTNVHFKDHSQHRY